jgi:xylulokinase
MLSAASCNKWLCDEILKTGDYAAEQEGITDDSLGSNNVFFLPYLMGERSPINDTDARGTFTGLSMDTTRQDIVQAVLEGVAFAIRDSLEVARSLGLDIRSSRICGGGAKSPLWRKMMANVLGITLEIPKAEEGPGYGGAMLAMVGCGEFGSVDACAESLLSITSKVEPDHETAARYEEKYRIFCKLYPALKGVFQELNR